MTLPGYEPAAPRRARHAADVDLAWAYEPQPEAAAARCTESGTPGQAVAPEPEPDLSWLAESGFLREDVAPELEPAAAALPEHELASDAVVERLVNAPAADMPSPATEDCEETIGKQANVTIEPIVDENVFDAQVQENVDVMVDCDVVPGLDKPESNPSFGGESSGAGIGNSVGQIGNPEVEIGDSQSQISKLLTGVSGLSKREKRRRRKERARREAERRVVEQLEQLPSDAAQLEFLINVMRSGTPADVAALLPRGMPRAPEGESRLIWPEQNVRWQQPVS